MQWYVFALTIICLPFAHGYVANKPYPTFAHCDQTLLSFIKANWLIMGKPRNTLQTAEQSGLFTVFHTSYDYLNSDNKCAYIKFNEGVMNVTFVPKEGNNVASLIYNVEQDTDGATIKAKPAEKDTPEYRFNWYPIYFSNGVGVFYVCSDIEGSQEIPLVTVMMTNKHKNLFTSSFTSTVTNMLTRWGLNFKHNYGPECILKE